MMDLDTSVRHYYHAKQLDRAKLDALIACAENLAAANRRRRHPKISISRPASLVALAASLPIVIALFMILQPGASMDINERAAHEIAMNHDKNLAMEYVGDDLEEISAEMTKLGFTLRRPAQMDLEDMTLIGARYCSIQGQIAALLKYKNQNGESVTLYQTQATAELGNLTLDNRIIDNTRIKIWREGKLIYGMAE